jgi:mono/diheme cytochrome c family protein
MNMSAYSSRLMLLGLALVLSSCRGETSKKPPVHPNLNMDYSQSFKPQERNAFFEDGRSMRMPVEGTVARGQTRLDTEYYEGKTATGAYVVTIPVEVTREMVKRGQDRYEVFCTPCHGGTGAGDGLVISRGYVQPQTYHQDRLRDVEDGYLYDVVANGIRNMPAYRRQIPTDDRWAIVAYVRALQRSQFANRADVAAMVTDAELRAIEEEWRAQAANSPASADTTQSPR